MTPTIPQSRIRPLARSFAASATYADCRAFSRLVGGIVPGRDGWREELYRAAAEVMAEKAGGLDRRKDI